MSRGNKKKKKSATCKTQAEPDEKTGEQFETRLASLILSKGLASSAEESVYLAETILSEMEESDLERENSCIAACGDYFSLSENDAKSMLAPLLGMEDPSNLESEENSGNDDFDYNEIDIDDGDFIGEGECELCERYIKLTKHHLIPKSTWPRMTSRLINAAEALHKNDLHRAGIILGTGLSHLLEPLTIIGPDKGAIKGLVQTTCDICRPCHTAIHKCHDNMTLATQFSTVELLLEDEQIYKFAKFASKQRSGKYAM